MKPSTLPLLLLSSLLPPLTSAWSITWNDPSGADHTRTGHGPSACIPIDNPKGHLFRIDAQGETGINMLLFTNADCTGDPAGMATDVFSKDASRDLLGFRVVRVESATATGSGNSTATATATSKTHSSHVATTGGSVSSSSGSVASTTTQVVVTSAATTTSSAAALGGASSSSSSSSAASASTSNAAVRVAGSSADVAMGVVGGMLGLVVVPMMI